MQHRRELFCQQKAIKDINEDSGLSSRDVPSTVESDSCIKGMEEENLSERVRKMLTLSNKSHHSMAQPLTPIAQRKSLFSLPRIFTQKKKDDASAAAVHRLSSVPTTVVTSTDEQPQLSPGTTTTTTTTSAYNTGADTGQESPPAYTTMSCSLADTTAHRTMLGARNTVRAETSMTKTLQYCHPSLLPTVQRARPLSRKQHVRFESDICSYLPQPVFYTSAERLAETIATQQRLLHNELSMSHQAALPKQQQQHQPLLTTSPNQHPKQQLHQQGQKKWSLIGQQIPLQQSKEKHMQQVNQRVQQQTPQMQGQERQYSNSQLRPRQIKIHHAAQQERPDPHHHQQREQCSYITLTGKQILCSQSTYPQREKDHKYTTNAVHHSSKLPPAMQQQHDPPTQQGNPQTNSLRRQQQQQIIHNSAQKSEKRSAAHHQPTECVSKEAPPKAQCRRLDNKIPTLHKAEKCLTAENVLLVDQELCHQHLPTTGSVSLLTSAPSSVGFKKQCDSSKLAYNLPRPDWPCGAELAELFSFKPTTPATASMQKQREKRRGSPSKQISGQHRQQPELEWVIKRRADGTRYVTRRPTRKRTNLSSLAAVKARREQSLARERAGMSTTDDDGGSEAVLGNTNVAPHWWALRRKKPPPIPSIFSPSSLARKKAPGGGFVIQTTQIDPQKAFTVTTV